MPNLTAGGVFHRFDGRKAVNPSSGAWNGVGVQDVMAEDTLVADIFETPLEASNFQYDDLALRENATFEKGDRAEIIKSTERWAPKTEATAFVVDVAEVYSPPRLTAAAPAHRLVPGAALDLDTGWDFTRAEHRREAKQLLAGGAEPQVCSVQLHAEPVEGQA